MFGSCWPEESPRETSRHSIRSSSPTGSFSGKTRESTKLGKMLQVMSSEWFGTKYFASGFLLSNFSAQGDLDLGKLYVFRLRGLQSHSSDGHHRTHTSQLHRQHGHGVSQYRFEHPVSRGHGVWGGIDIRGGSHAVSVSLTWSCTGVTTWCFSFDAKNFVADIGLRANILGDLVLDYFTFWVSLEGVDEVRTLARWTIWCVCNNVLDRVGKSSLGVIQTFGARRWVVLWRNLFQFEITGFLFDDEYSAYLTETIKERASEIAAENAPRINEIVGQLIVNLVAAGGEEGLLVFLLDECLGALRKG